MSAPLVGNETTGHLAMGPLVNLLDSEEHRKHQQHQQHQQQQQQQPSQAELAVGDSERPTLHHFDDSQVPPEAGVVSEQPEVSNVRQMRAELEMHRRNAKAQVGFVSQSGEQHIGGGQSRSQRRHHSRRRDARHERRWRDDANVRSASTSSPSHSSHSSRTRSGSSHTRTTRNDTLLSNAVQQSIRDDEQAGVVSDARKFSTGAKPMNSAAVDKLDSAKSFLKGNLTLIVTCIVLLALVGVTVYLMFKSNTDSAERDAERERERALAAEEERMRERDAVLQELQKENEQLKSAYETTAAAISQYEQHLQQYHTQTNAQMQALEALETQNNEYERALAEWQNLYAQIESEKVHENNNNGSAVGAEQESGEHADAVYEQTVQVKEERSRTPDVQIGGKQDYSDNNINTQEETEEHLEVLQQYESASALPVQGEQQHSSESPTKLLPPLENREQVPFGTLADAASAGSNTEQ